MNLDFYYKGDRNYVHGTSMYEEIMTLLESRGFHRISNLDWRFGKILRNNLDYEILRDYQLKGREWDSSLKFTFNGFNYVVILKENNSRIAKRKVYLESSIVEKTQCNIANKSINLRRIEGFTTIECLVAINKALHEKVLNPASGKWYFTRLQIQKPLPSNWSSLDVYLVNAKNARLTKGDVYIDEQCIGCIFFSLKV
jgi:hypothetical protein